MTEPTKPETVVAEAVATEQPDAVQARLDDPRSAIYAKSDAIRAAEAEAEAAPPVEEAPEETPPEKASEPEGKSVAEPVKEPEFEELTSEEFAERFKNVKVKGKFAGEEAVVDAKDLLRVQGLDRHLTKRLQEVARKEEALGAAQPPPSEYRPAGVAPPDSNALRNEDEVASKYDELFSESPYKANQFLQAVQAERQRAQAANEKVRMDTAERDFLAIHPEMEPADYESMKSSFAEPDFFRRNPDVDDAFQRRDYRGALELARVKLVEKRLNDQLSAIKTAQAAVLAEEQKRTELKKKGSVIRTASKPEVKQKEEFKPPTPEEYIRQMQSKRRVAMNIK